MEPGLQAAKGEGEKAAVWGRVVCDGPGAEVVRSGGTGAVH